MPWTVFETTNIIKEDLITKSISYSNFQSEGGACREAYEIEFQPVFPYVAGNTYRGSIRSVSYTNENLQEVTSDYTYNVILFYNGWGSVNWDFRYTYGTTRKFNNNFSVFSSITALDYGSTAYQDTTINIRNNSATYQYTTETFILTISSYETTIQTTYLRYIPSWIESLSSIQYIFQSYSQISSTTTNFTATKISTRYVSEEYFSPGNTLNTVFLAKENEWLVYITETELMQLKFLSDQLITDSFKQTALRMIETFTLPTLYVALEPFEPFNANDYTFAKNILNRTFVSTAITINTFTHIYVTIERQIESRYPSPLFSIASYILTSSTRSTTILTAIDENTTLEVIHGDATESITYVISGPTSISFNLDDIEYISTIYTTDTGYYIHSLTVCLEMHSSYNGEGEYFMHLPLGGSPFGFLCTGPNAYQYYYSEAFNSFRYKGLVMVPKYYSTLQATQFHKKGHDNLHQNPTNIGKTAPRFNSLSIDFTTLLNNYNTYLHDGGLFGYGAQKEILAPILYYDSYSWASIQGTQTTVYQTKWDTVENKIKGTHKVLVGSSSNIETLNSFTFIGTFINGDNNTETFYTTDSLSYHLETVHSLGGYGSFTNTEKTIAKYGPHKYTHVIDGNSVEYIVTDDFQTSVLKDGEQDIISHLNIIKLTRADSYIHEVFLTFEKNTY